MHTNCIFCRSHLGEHEIVETFPGGRGLACGVLAGTRSQMFKWTPQAINASRRQRVVARVPIKGGEPLAVRGKHVEQARLVQDAASDSGWCLHLPHAKGKAVLGGREGM